MVTSPQELDFQLDPQYPGRSLEASRRLLEPVASRYRSRVVRFRDSQREVRGSEGGDSRVFSFPPDECCLARSTCRFQSAENLLNALSSASTDSRANSPSCSPIEHRRVPKVNSCDWADSGLEHIGAPVPEGIVAANQPEPRVRTG